MYQQFFGGLGFIVGIIATLIYVISIFKGHSKPHLFTWLVWGILALIGYLAQLHDNAGAGSWSMGITSASCLFIAALAVKYGEKNITRSDWVAFICSLSAIIPWLYTKDPLGSVILISIIDFVAFYPTFRKSWNNPWDENLPSYHLQNLKFIVSLPAYNSYTLTSLLYALTIIAANSLFIGLCTLRKKALKEKQN